MATIEQRTGRDGQQVYRVKVRRKGAPPLTATIPGGYERTTFQATSISFPTAGCWEVRGVAGDAQLAFVVRIP